MKVCRKVQMGRVYNSRARLPAFAPAADISQAAWQTSGKADLSNTAWTARQAATGKPSRMRVTCRPRVRRTPQWPFIPTHATSSPLQSVYRKRCRVSLVDVRLHGRQSSPEPVSPCFAEGSLRAFWSLVTAMTPRLLVANTTRSGRLATRKRR